MACISIAFTDRHIHSTVSADHDSANNSEDCTKDESDHAHQPDPDTR